MGSEFSSSLAGIKTIPERLQFFSKNHPDRELFVFYNKREDKRYPYTAEQVVRLAGKFAYRLRQNGFNKGDVIANTLPNSPERVITDIGIMMAGCISMNGQILLLDGSDFFGSAKISRCKSIIMCPNEDIPAWKLFKPFITGDTTTFTTGISCSHTPDMTSVILVSRQAIRNKAPLLQDLETSQEKRLYEDTDPDGTFTVFTTSGSTGYSKLVPRNQTDFINLCDDAVADSKSKNTDFSGPTYNDRPLGWAGGFPLSTYSHGETRVMIDTLVDHGETNGSTIWNVIRREQCKSVVLLASEMDKISTHLDSLGGSDYKIKLVLTGAHPISKPLLKIFFKITEVVTFFYGSTEAIPITSTILTEDSEFQDFFCGKPHPGVYVRVVNESGQDCAPMETGTILIKGKGVFKGYFNRLEDPDPQTVKAFTPDGWLNMGDMGYLDKDGNTYVIGRKNDVIMYGPVVLYPGWLENKILEHPDVKEACVLPVSDPLLYHNICACVTLVPGSDLTEESLRTYCEGIFITNLNSEQTPMPKFFMILQDFPRTFSGKVDKKQLKLTAEEKFGYKSKEADL